MERTWREVFSDCFLFVDGMVLLSFFFSNRRVWPRGSFEFPDVWSRFGSCSVFGARDWGIWGRRDFGWTFEAIGTLDPLCPHHGPIQRSSTTRRFDDVAELHLLYATDTTVSEQDVASGCLLSSTAMQKFLDLTTAPTFPNSTTPTILFLRVTQVSCGDATDKRRLLLQPEPTHTKVLP